MRRWVLAEFGSEAQLLEGVRSLRAQGFRRLDTYTPFPLPEVDEALGLRPSPVGWVALAAGLGGALFGFLVQAFTHAVDWPLIVGSRPFLSSAAFVPITFELGVLSAALAISGALMVLFGFPRVAHPILALEAFRSASVDRFWVSVTTEADEVARRAEEALRALGARQVSVLEERP